MVITSANTTQKVGKALKLSKMEGLELADGMGVIFMVKEPSICPMVLSIMVIGDLIRSTRTVYILQAMDRSKIRHGITIDNCDKNLHWLLKSQGNGLRHGRLH